jgi:diaminopimelate decarboxylase
MTSLPLHLLARHRHRRRPTGRCAIGGVRVPTSSRTRFGTPTVRLRRGVHLRAGAAEAVAAFGRERAVYATKAFLCTAMARLAYEEGMLLDVASGGELYVALRAPACRPSAA